jgi:DNA-binding transcriptional LysR family regulator
VTDSQATPSFRLAYVPGVTPSKWVGVWRERLPLVPLTLVALPAAEGAPALEQGDADAGLVRLPVDRTNLSAIPLYTETTVVLVPKEHRLAEAAEVTVGDLADDILLHPLDDVIGWETLPGLPAKQRPATTADAVDLVAAGIGLLVVPQSLARLHHRRDLDYRPVTDAPQSQVALSWLQDRTTDLVEEFIGIVRGRTVNSTRGRAETEPQPKQQQRSAKGDNRRQGGAPAGGGRPRSGSGKPGTGRGGAGKGGSGRGGKPGRRS